MESSQSNKYIMAFMATVFAVMTIGITSDAVFSPQHPEESGYVIEVADASAPAGAAEAPAKVSIATLLETADPKRGEAVFKRCAACHTSEKGGANKIGPHLWDVVNRPIASVGDFSYSSAMKAFAEGGEVWDYNHLNEFLTSPKGYIKGTAMGFAGDKKDNERSDLIAYLRSLSDNPAPLPVAEPAVSAEPETTPEEPTATETAPADTETPVAPETTETAPDAPTDVPAAND